MAVFRERGVGGYSTLEGKNCQKDLIFCQFISGDDENLILMSATSSEIESKPGSEMADSTVSMTSWSTEDFSSSS